MRPAFILALFLFPVFCATTLFAQCPAGFDSVRLEINPDYAFWEASWKIYEKNDPAVVYETGSLASDSLYIFNYCIPQGACKVFDLADDHGDGMFPDGVYRLYVNGLLLRESIGYYGSGQTTDFGCAPGSTCNSALTMTLGSSATPDGEEAWYRFVPAESGIYTISTCGAACPTKIWVYDNCNGILISENLVGAIFYADSGCPDGSASATVQLAGGVEYFIRIRYAVPNCSTEAVPYTVTYLGPIIGCMDPAACNYDPLATVSSGVCLYPGDPNCPQAPDISIDQNLLRSSLILADEISTDPCRVQEGCLRGFGNRHVVKFDTRISNIGNADFYVGIPPANQNDPSSQFVYDPCHGHWHYLGYAEYILFNSAGKRIPIGSKNGFCILDAQCPFGILAKYKCNNMGITAGCSDIYDYQFTPCQWIDITGIPADNYTLVARVNWDRSPDKIGRVEKTFDNNWAQACFNLSYDGETPEAVFNTDSCIQYTDCTGELFGSAQPDCNGVCNGPALFGDWNLDTLRNSSDVVSYQLAALATNSDATPCNDLDEDGQINVYDAALLQECTIHGDSQQYWIQRFPCQFPAGLYNEQDLVTIGPGALDTLAKTFDIEMANPFNGVMAYEFRVSGLKIDSVENLVPEYQALPIFNPATGEILALAADESSIKKSFSLTAFLRVHYSAFTDNEVCVAEITAVVNNKYHRSNATLGNPNCLPVNYVAVKEPVAAPFAVFVQPNPMRESTTVFFENSAGEPMQFSLADLTGRTVRAFSDLRGESVSIEREGLPEGTYLFTLRCSRGSVMGKVVMH